MRAPATLPRRLVPTLALACYLTAMAGSIPPSVPDEAVHVAAAAQGGFVIDLVTVAPVDVPQAWSVLTDFDHMARFVPNLTRSQVLANNGTTLQVSQNGVARFGPFSTEINSTREIQLTPRREIRAHGTGGNLKRMDSLMQLEPAADGTHLHYHAEILPGFWFPAWIGNALLRHETAEQFSAIIAEMIRRQNVSQSAP